MDHVKYVEGPYANMQDNVVKMSIAFTWQDVCQIHKIQTTKKIKLLLKCGLIHHISITMKKEKKSDLMQSFRYSAMIQFHLFAHLIHKRFWLFT